MLNKNYKNRSFRIESLETRQLMAANLYLDFGQAFDWSAAAGEHEFDVELLSDDRVNGPSHTHVPYTLSSFGRRTRHTQSRLQPGRLRELQRCHGTGAGHRRLG